MLEPHYDLITSADQVQIYESVLGNTDGNVTQTLLRAVEYLKDNRQTPAGFDKNRIPDNVAVEGTAANTCQSATISGSGFPIAADGGLMPR